jgi:hypothetical protein
MDEVSNDHLVSLTAAQPPHPTENREVTGSTPAIAGAFVISGAGTRVTPL